MAQWRPSTNAGSADKIDGEGQRPLRTMLEERYAGVELEAAVSMLSRVVACPAIMFGTLPRRRRHRRGRRHRAAA